MNAIRYTLLFFLLFTLQQSGFTQINPNQTGDAPLLQCVKNEPSNQIQIQWNAPSNVGPCFSQYAIYISRGNRNGPYIKIDSVATSISGTRIIDPAFSGLVYVYMVNEQSCNNPAPSVLTTDTLDNILPLPAITIVNLTVENDKARINWIPSTNPEVQDYVIYSNVNNFNTPIDTVLGRNSSFYIDPNSNPSVDIAVYRIRTLEFCESDTGLLGNITPSYNTMKLEVGDEEPCARAVTLTWNGYNNQSAGVLNYVIEISTDAGATFTAIDTLGEAVRTYILNGLSVDVVTCIQVRALLPGGISSVSSLACKLGTGVAPVELHYIQNLSVGSDAVTIEYVADANAPVNEPVLERSVNGLNFTVLTSGVSVQQPIPGGPYTIKDFSALTNRAPYIYRVSVKNQCNDTYSTLQAKTIFLEGENKGLDNILKWSDFNIDISSLENFELLRISETDTVVAFSSTNAQLFTDKDIYANNNFDQTCYIVKAYHSFSDTDRPVGQFVSFSNQVCLQPKPQGFVPNAFAPDGTNKLFRPILVFATQENYLFEVFNRYGQKVFSSIRPGEGWDGKNKGEPAPVDSYIYKLQFTGLDNVVYNRTGFVLLAR